MGIIVTITMLLGLIILRPSPWRASHSVRQDLRFVTFSATCLAIFGAWNALWYGVRHLTEFWGLVSIVSGVTMMLAGMLVFTERSTPQQGGDSFLSMFRRGVIGILAVSFLLYAVTLVQLNLGLPILGR